MHWWRFVGNGESVNLHYTRHDPAGVRIYTWWYVDVNGTLQYTMEGGCPALGPCVFPNTRRGETYYVKTQIIESLEPTGCTTLYFDP